MGGSQQDSKSNWSTSISQNIINQGKVGENFEDMGFIRPEDPLKHSDGHCWLSADQPKLDSTVWSAVQGVV